ncbi:MAG: hypothetical protein JXR52_10615 [Bacteroidales bacterium]|nr:hypothetical protein [Bacteroidales bacterium]HDS07520.1 hypothetical protein [Bacteroides sp.]
MNKKNLTVIVVLVIAVILLIIVMDFSKNRPGKLGENPYAYDVDEFVTVDPSWIHYKETRNIPLKNRQCTGFDIFENEIYIVGEQFLQVITTDGRQKLFRELEAIPTCIKAEHDKLYIGFERFLQLFDHEGNKLASWEELGEKTVITSVAVKGEYIYVADAGNRRVVIYDSSGVVKHEFEGKSTSEAGHGFIVPSPNFDLVVNNYGELWVVNPGKHAIENYTDDGEMRGFWQGSSMSVEGFTGCCNPAEIAVMEDGSFVTSEKGLVRIKIYDPSGRLKSVVAPPDKFKEEGRAPEVDTDETGIIYALDFDKMMIRIFEPK